MTRRAAAPALLLALQQLAAGLAFLTLGAGGIRLPVAAPLAAVLALATVAICALLAVLATGRLAARSVAPPAAAAGVGGLAFLGVAWGVARGLRWGWDHAALLGGLAGLAVALAILRRRRRPATFAVSRPVAAARPPARRGRWAVALLALLVAALMFVHMMPNGVSWQGLGLDGAWQRVVPWALAQDRVFGREIIYTYGPLGWLFSGVPSSALLPAAVAYNTVFALLFASGLALAAGGWRWSLPLVLLILLVDLPHRYNTSYVLALLLLIFVAGREGGGWRLAWALAATCFLGVIALGKYSHAAPALLAVGALDLDRWLSRRAPPIFVPLFLAAIAATQLAIGQPLSALPDQARAALLVIAGYAQAMQLEMANGDVPILLCGYAVLVLVTALAAGRLAQGDRLQARRGLVLTLVVAGFCFASWKAGMVRGHLDALTGLGALSLPLLAAPWARALPRAGPLIAVLLVAVSVQAHYGKIGAAFLTSGYNPWSWLVRQYDLASAFASGELAAAMDRQVVELDAQLRQAAPWPPLRGPVDVIGDQQLPALAWGVDYRPRPAFQSIVAMTPALERINLEHYRSADAPRHVFVDWQSIDGRWPGAEEGELRLELLARYEPVGLVGGHLQLVRRAQPLRITLEPLEPLVLRFGRSATLPPTDGLVFARLELERTLLGRLSEALWRAPILRMAYTLEGGGQGGSRLLRENARAGFLLSPRVYDLASGAQLWSPALEGLGPLRVRSVELLLPRQARWVYGEEAVLRLYRVRFAPE